jgi:hypothetical protein
MPPQLWKPGQSGNPAGRPRRGLAAQEIARRLIKKHKLFERLLDGALGRGDFKDSAPKDMRESMRLLLAYGYGQPMQMVAKHEEKDVQITVTYVDESNRVGTSSVAPGAAASNGRAQTLQLPDGGSQVRQIDLRPASADE